MNHTTSPALILFLLLPALLVLGLPAPVAADEAPDLLATARADGRFVTLVAAVERAGLTAALQGDGPLTVFAPTDEAFAALPAGALARLLTPAGRADLQRILTHHVVKGRVTSADLLRATEAQTLAGTALPLRLRVGDANVVQADVACRNGMIHVIDRVLLPPARVTEPTLEVTAVIDAAIARGVPLFNQGHEAACARIYDEAAKRLLDPDGALGAWDRAELAAARAKAADTPAARAWNLRHAFDGILANAAFEPSMEASLPAGFPKPGPVGRIIRKQYPKYRAARSDGGAAFWTLFQHIKANKVEMTAPVEMTLDGEGRMRDMAFLYERPDQGRAGQQGRVDVLDLSSTQVLSMGMRGRRGAGALERAKKLMTAWMAEQGIEAAGPWRVLGYNSPMVPASRQFWELQVPIAR